MTSGVVIYRLVECLMFIRRWTLYVSRQKVDCFDKNSHQVWLKNINAFSIIYIRLDYNHYSVSRISRIESVLKAKLNKNLKYTLYLIVLHTYCSDINKSNSYPPPSFFPENGSCNKIDNSSIEQRLIQQARVSYRYIYVIH